MNKYFPKSRKKEHLSLPDPQEMSEPVDYSLNESCGDGLYFLFGLKLVVMDGH